jgi:tetratricopeptide (TPR) repeat protein/AraC-like DNA-binding protein/TolB-like protein
MPERLNTDQIFIGKLTEITLANLMDENFSVDGLAYESGMSRKVLGRKLHSIKKVTIAQFIGEVRLQKAMEILQKENFTASEVSYKTGFSSPAYFNKCFHKFFGYPPGEVKKRVARNEEMHIQNKDEYKSDLKIPTRYYHLQPLHGIIVLTIIVAIGFLIYRSLGKSELSDDLVSSDGRISVAVMPFQNVTNDTTLNIWKEGIQFNLITSLSNFSEELKVSNIESINGAVISKSITDYASITPSVSRTISRELGANLFLFGNINLSSSTLRLNAQLINSNTQEILIAFQIDGESDNMLPIIDSLSVSVQKFLIITLLKRELNPEDRRYVNTKSPEAFRYYLYGVKAFIKSDFTLAKDLYLKAITIDSNYYDAFYGIYFSYVNQENWEQAKKWCLRFYKKSDHMAVVEKIWINYAHAYCFETPNEEIKYLNLLKDHDKISGDPYFLAGDAYYRLGLYNKAINELEKARYQYEKWGTKPEAVWTFTTLGLAYNKTGQYKKERSLCKKAEQFFPHDPDIMAMRAILTLSEGRAKLAGKYIENYITLRKEQSWSESNIASSLAEIYSEAGMMDKAEKYYLEALSFEPKDPIRINNLAYFLINKDRNIDEGLELAEKSLELIPGDYRFLDTKGWGLYKKGKIKEALEILQRSWHLRRDVSIYDHDAYLHFYEVQTASVNNK